MAILQVDALRTAEALAHSNALRVRDPKRLANRTALPAWTTVVLAVATVALAVVTISNG